MQKNHSCDTVLETTTIMTIREDELIEEINALQVKLEHAQKWMNRQVLEDARTGK